ncbi:MAG: hypothetical protein V1689_05775 [Pseudomonadota bacterium]
MLETIAKILFEKIVGFIKSPDELNEKLAKREIVFLHEALVECQMAFEKYSKSKTKDDRKEWSLAVLTLARALRNVRLTLFALSPDGFGYSFEYFMDEVSDSFIGEGFTTPEVIELKKLDNILHRFAATPLDKMQSKDTFGVAIKEIQKVIQSKLTVGEIRDGQKQFKTFKTKTMPQVRL